MRGLTPMVRYHLFALASLWRMTCIHEGLFSGAKRQKFFGAGFGLMTALCYPDADLERLGTTMDFILWLFSVSTLEDYVTFEH